MGSWVDSLFLGDERGKETDQVGFEILLEFLHERNRSMVRGGIQPLDPADELVAHDVMKTPVDMLFKEFNAALFVSHAHDESMIPVKRLEKRGKGAIIELATPVRSSFERACKSLEEDRGNTCRGRDTASLPSRALDICTSSLLPLF